MKKVLKSIMKTCTGGGYYTRGIACPRFVW